MKRTENIVFGEYCKADGEPKERLELELHKMLLAHAMSVCWLQLKDYRPDIANFCVQKAFQKMGNFRGDAKFSTWFHRICLNACTSSLRDKIKQAEVPLDAVGEKGQDQEGALLAKLQIERIREALSDEDRELLDWKLQALDEVAIAKMTGLTTSGVRTRWSRLRKRILRQLKK